MAGITTGVVLRQLQALFDRGTAGGLADGPLLDRFAAHRDEDAFTALVERHGPMVLRLCRQILGDEHEAQDAAQAAFLVLARRAGSIRRRDSVASWLYRVARRIAMRARVGAARRREIEWRKAQMSPGAIGDDRPSVPQAELYEELDRLSERYRAPLVLCYLEGLTHEQAARHLRCPVRTVETRLQRGRARLRERLIRRGVVPSAVLAVAARSAPAALPPTWSAAAVRAGVAFSASRAAAVGIASAHTLTLAQGVLRVMIVQKLGAVFLSLAILGGLAVAVGGGVGASPGQNPDEPTGADPAPVPAAIAPVVASVAAPLPGNPSAVPAQKASKKDDARELSYDDGEMRGKRSIAGGGHAVRFEAPGEGWTLTAVKVHGARYGTRRAPREDFAVFLCDEKFHQISEFLFPYSKFERGDSKWVTLEVKPTKIPKTFILGVDFDPTQTKGVYVSFDREGSDRSMVGLPNERHRPFKQGDWLIRVRIEPPAEKR